MSSKDIDIQKKCPDGRDEKGRCKDDGVIHAEKGNLPGDAADYGYVTHSKISGEGIGELTYGGQPLKIENEKGGSPKKFREKYPNLDRVTTYYYTKNDGDNDHINVPLILRARNNVGPYYLYLNIGGNHTKWKEVPLSDKLTIHTDHDTNQELTILLKNQACALHNLHSVDIYKDKSYECACSSKVKVNVEPDTNGTVEGYNKYKHSYDKTVMTVKYSNTLLKFKDDDKPIPLDSEKTPNLSVYYWDKDIGHKKPILMEVAFQGRNVFGGMEFVIEGFGSVKVPVVNDGEKNNREWTIIEDYDFLLEEPVSKDVLHKQKCKLFKPAIIDASQKITYPNTYCKEEMNGECKNDICNDMVTVSPYGLSLESYTAFWHTYGTGRETFTVTGFKNGLSVQELTFPIWDVDEVVVFFFKCIHPIDKAAETPLMVYVGSNGDDGKDHKWYSRSNNDKWEENTELKGKDPKTADSNGDLQGVLKSIKSKLNIKCKEEIERERKLAEEQARKEKEAEAIRNQIITDAVEVQSQQQQQLPPPPPPLPGGAHSSPVIGSHVVSNSIAGSSGGDTVELLDAAGEAVGHLVAGSVLAGLYGPAIASALVPVGLGVAKGTLKLVNDLATKAAPEAPPPQSVPSEGSIQEVDGPDNTVTQSAQGHASDELLEQKPTAPTEDSPAQQQALAQSASDLSPVAQRRKTPSGSKNLPRDIGIFGTLATVVSGLAGFAGFKFYTKYKADPWVRQI